MGNLAPSCRTLQNWGISHWTSSCPVHSEVYTVKIDARDVEKMLFIAASRVDDYQHGLGRSSSKMYALNDGGTGRNTQTNDSISWGFDGKQFTINASPTNAGGLVPTLGCLFDIPPSPVDTLNGRPSTGTYFPSRLPDPTTTNAASKGGKRHRRVRLQKTRAMRTTRATRRKRRR